MGCIGLVSEYRNHKKQQCAKIAEWRWDSTWNWRTDLLQYPAVWWQCIYFLLSSLFNCYSILFNIIQYSTSLYPHLYPQAPISTYQYHPTISGPSPYCIRISQRVVLQSGIQDGTASRVAEPWGFWPDGISPATGAIQWNPGWSRRTNFCRDGIGGSPEVSSGQAREVVIGSSPAMKQLANMDAPGSDLGHVD